jgi:hypothetical protein
MRKRTLALLALLGVLPAAAYAFNLTDGLYDRRGADGLHSTVEISSGGGGSKKSVNRLNADLDFGICKLTIHAVSETNIPAGYNQSDYLKGKTTSCSATNNTCGSNPTCDDPLPTRFVQTTANRLCLSWQGSSDEWCYNKISLEKAKSSLTVGGIKIDRQ